MKRMPVPARPDWRKKVEDLGFIFHTVDGEPYWDETACYGFSAQEIDTLESAANQLHALCLDAVEHVIAGARFTQMGIPEALVPLILSSWEQDRPTMYGRFDLAYDGQGSPRLLEYNADTPTSLLEAAVVQWYWLEDIFPKADQFNSIHEQLVDAWKWMKESVVLDNILHFASMEDVEDEITVTYMMDVASQAGIATNRILLKDIGWHDGLQQFVDLENRPMTNIFKLYPWEWLPRDAFWPHVRDTFGQTRWIEPAWKMILSSKGILPILWELHPGHPLLLEAHFDDPHGMTEYAMKPLLSREGANVTIQDNTATFSSGGDYGEEGHIYQALAPIPNMEGNYPVLGVWIVGDAACGMGIRESRTPITNNQSRFVPHFFAQPGVSIAQ